MNSKINYWRHISFVIGSVSVIYLIYKDISFIESLFVVLIPSFTNYMDGIYRGKNINN